MPRPATMRASTMGARTAMLMDQPQHAEGATAPPGASEERRASALGI